MEIWQCDIGDTVVCDYCNRDYTESEATGGLIVGSYAVCPKCERNSLLKDADYVSKPGETFKDFVLRVREHNTVGIYTF